MKHLRSFFAVLLAAAVCAAVVLFSGCGASVQVQQLTIPGERGSIHATLTTPANAENMPAVVICHGFTGSRSGEFFALRVRGESMLGVGILPDDLVVVHRQNLAQNGQIVVALLGDEATVKTLKRKGSEVWLMPANPDYQPIDGRECTILGRVVAVVRQY